MSKTPALSARTDRPTIDRRLFADATDALRRRAGLVFPEARHEGVEAAILRVMKHAGVVDLPAMIALLVEGGAVFDDLVAEVTIGESYFFREPAQFEVIRDLILPDLRSRWPRRRIRAWSAAASTGEEAYSLAITLRQQNIDGEVIATDISRPRLRAARRGSYRQWSFRGVPQPTIDRWFRRDGDRFIVDPEVRASVDYRYLNLAEDSYPAMSTGVWGMDLILCRNVLIYFDPQTIARVATRLLDSLTEDGWLILGSSDPASAELVSADAVDTPAGIAYRRARGGRSSIRGSRQDHPTLPAAEWNPPPRPETALPLEPVPVPTADSGTSNALVDVPGVVTDDAMADAYATRDYAEVVRLGDLSPDTAPVARQVLLIRALANLGQLDQAGRVCAAALDRDRDVAELHYLHSILLMESGRPADAAAAARRALYLDRELVVAHLALATASARARATAPARNAR